MPKISIILPTYNVEKYIARALDSCINQTLKDIEIIVVDDKGQDNSIKIAKEYMSKDDRIKIIDNIVNQGVLKSRINGANNSSSDLLMFLDPDDELELNTCEILFNAIQNNNVDIVVFNIKIIDGDRVKVMWDKDFGNCVLKIDLYKNYFEEFGWGMSNKLYKKAVVNDIIKHIDRISFKWNLLEDFIFSYFMVRECDNIYVISNLFHHYYMNDGSLTHSNDYGTILFNLNIFKNVINIIQKEQQDLDFNIKIVKILKRIYAIYGSNNLKKYRFNNAILFCIYLKFKILKTIEKLKYSRVNNAKNINNTTNI